MSTHIPGSVATQYIILRRSDIILYIIFCCWPL
nr:MAG TPA: Lens epithelial cell protein [Caudoviricetes sp.]